MRGQTGILTAICVLTVGGATTSAAATRNWLAVEAWTGSYRIEHIRSLDEKQLLGFSITGQIRNIASGTVTFDRKVDPETWAGTGTAVCSVSEEQKLCHDGAAVACRDKEIKGSGEVALGGEELEGIEVEHIEVPLGGR